MKKAEINKFTKEMTIGEILKKNPKTKEVLMGFGMHCFGCPMSQSETLEEAAMSHGTDVNFILKKLNQID